MPHTRILENFVLNETLLLEGADWNNTIIRNVIIENVDGSGILLRDVENIRIENVTIRNVTGDGIKLSTLGSTSDVVIVDSHISDVGDDGINAGQRAQNGVDHPGLQIIDNTIENVGLNGTSAGLMHGMYIQTTDFLIQGNHISGVQDGNGISARSSGQIIDNYIEDTRQSGIAYFPDNVKGDSDQLTITGNVLVNTGQGTDRSDINLLEVRSGWEDQVVETITIANNILTKPQESAVTVNPDYGALNIEISQQWNQFVEETIARMELNTGDYGGTGSTFVPGPDTDLSPGGGILPDLFGDDNMRLTLGDAHLGRTDVIATLGQDLLADQMLEAGTEMAFTNIFPMGMIASAFSGSAPARIGIDGGQMAVISAGEEANFAGSGSMEISGDEVIVVSFENAPVGEVNQAIFGVIGADPNETISFDLFSGGSFLGRFEQTAQQVMQLQSNVSFDELRISAGENTGFSLNWAEFGHVEDPQNVNAQVSTTTTELTLQERSNGRTLASFGTDGDVEASTTVSGNTRFTEVTISELSLKLSANGRKVSVDSGEMGVSSSGENGNARYEISGGEELVFGFRDEDSVSAVLELANLGQEEMVIVEAFHDGRKIATTTYIGEQIIEVEDIGAFDMLAISAGADSSFSVESIEAERVDVTPLDLL